MSWLIAFCLAAAVIAYLIGAHASADSDETALGIMIIGYLDDPEVSHITVTRGDVYPGEIEVYAERIGESEEDE